MMLHNRMNKITIFIFVIFYLIYTPVSRAQSKSERIKRLRGKSCIEDIRRTKMRISNLERLLSDITQAQQSMTNSSLQALFNDNSSRTKTTLSNLLSVLISHNRTKQAICAQLGPVPGDATSGYKEMSKSDRIRRIRSDYCANDKQYGEAIRREIPIVKTAMKKMLGGNPPDESLSNLLRQLQNQWSRINPALDNLYDEQMLAKKICKGIEQGLSKSELIRLNRKGIGRGRPAPYFLYLITNQ